MSLLGGFHFLTPSGHPVQLAHSYELVPRAEPVLASMIDEFVNRVIRHDGLDSLSVVHVTLVRRKQMPERLPSPCHPRDVFNVFLL